MADKSLNKCWSCYKNIEAKKGNREKMNSEAGRNIFLSLFLLSHRDKMNGLFAFDISFKLALFSKSKSTLKCM